MSSLRLLDHYEFLRKGVVLYEDHSTIPEEAECSICGEFCVTDSLEGDPSGFLRRIVQVSTCKDYFHRGCFMYWSQTTARESGECPTCQRRIFIYQKPLTLLQVRELYGEGKSSVPTNHQFHDEYIDIQERFTELMAIRRTVQEMSVGSKEREELNDFCNQWSTALYERVQRLQQDVNGISDTQEKYSDIQKQNDYPTADAAEATVEEALSPIESVSPIRTNPHLRHLLG